VQQAEPLVGLAESEPVALRPEPELVLVEQQRPELGLPHFGREASSGTRSATHHSS